MVCTDPLLLLPPALSHRAYCYVVRKPPAQDRSCESSFASFYALCLCYALCVLRVLCIMLWVVGVSLLWWGI
jgi:hypothetical protein